jgi:hypothetical protein
MDLKLPKVVSDLLAAQKNYDSDAYADCFSETAVVFDEGNKYNSRKEIKDWIEAANQKYRTRKAAVKYSGTESAGILTAEVSGDFNAFKTFFECTSSNFIARFIITDKSPCFSTRKNISKITATH